MGSRLCSKSSQDDCYGDENRKPVLYLYPEEPIDVKIKLNFKNSKLACIYPKFNELENTWKVRASPNGEIKILDKNIHIYFGRQSLILNKI